MIYNLLTFLLASSTVVATQASASERELLVESLLLGETTARKIIENPSAFTTKQAAYQHVFHEEKALEGVLADHEKFSLLQTSANVTESNFYNDNMVIAGESQAAGKKIKLNDKSIAKAVKILNVMIENAEEEVDKVTITCKAFHARNRALYNAIISDLGRLGAEMSNLDRVKAASNACIAEAKQNVQSLEEKMAAAEGEYKRQFALDDAELTVRKNDLAVGEFIMKVTKCDPKKKKLLLMQKSQEEDQSVVEFLDADVQDKLMSMMNTDSKNLLSKAMDASFSGKRVAGAGLASTEDVSADDYENAESDDDVSFVQENAECALSLAEQSGPKNVPPRKRQSRKCSRGRVNMCLINDNMSLMWGEMKDAVDELTDQMKKKENDHEQDMTALNDQLKTETDTKNKCTDNLNEATGRRNQVTEEQSGKMDEKDEVNKEFKKVWGNCKATLEKLVYTKMCGVRIVRGDISSKGTKFKPTDIVDCEVSEFVPGKCSQKCDKKKKGVAKAGSTILTREVLQKNNTHGAGCPRLAYPTTCNAFLCPVDCRHSSWSAYGKCTKECEGGTKLRTRRITRQPLNGGKWCEDTVDTQSCNTRSCDRNCRLHKWTKWTYCSQACDGGFKERFRKIRVPTRGRGWCWWKHSRRRWQKKGCNKQKCQGDEQCIGRVDMVIAIDASGSAKETGFELFKNFTGELVKRFKAKKYKRKAMKVGVVQFGNGAIVTDKSGQSTVKSAKIISPLTFKLKELLKKIKDMKWSGGFTNMAQAFTMSENLFRDGGRKRAQSQVLVISDGKPSFKYQTEKAAMDLRDANVHVNMVTVHAMKGSDEVKLMKKWASRPSRAHMIWIPGFKGLVANSAQLVTDTLVQFCPRSQSPSLMKKKEKKRGFKLVVEKRDCLEWWWRIHRHCPGRRCRNRTDCSAAARKIGAKYFVVYALRWWNIAFCYGHKRNDGKCKFPKQWWMRKGGWTRSVFSVYALEGETGADEAKSSLIQLDKEGKRPEDGKPGSHDEETENPGPLMNRPEEDFPEDYDEVDETKIDDNTDDDDEI